MLMEGANAGLKGMEALMWCQQEPGLIQHSISEQMGSVMINSLVDHVMLRLYHGC
jgi:hypothetical protein